MDDLLRKRILGRLALINDKIENRNKSDYSLFAGEPGVLLFKFKYLNYINKTNEFLQFETDLQNLANNSIFFDSPSLCRGKAGSDWFFLYLSKLDIVESRFVNSLIANKKAMASTAISLLNTNNYDFLHGALGIITYLLYADYRDGDFYSEFFQSIDQLEKKSVTKRVVPEFDFFKLALNPNKVNLGLAHGVVSLLKVLLIIYSNGVQMSNAKSCAENIIKFLVNSVNKITKTSFFPNSVSLENHENVEYSRLGWCYGDLTVAFILLQSAILFKNESLKEFATNVLEQSTERKLFIETSVIDAGICHGSAGIFHIYNRVWKITGNPIFKSAALNWVAKTLEFPFENTEGSVYRRFNGKENVFETSFGLLEGDAGIGLAFLSILNDDIDWDYILLLGEV